MKTIFRSIVMLSALSLLSVSAFAQKPAAKPAAKPTDKMATKPAAKATGKK